MSEAEAYVGIDVSKAELEVAVEDEGWTVSNDESGIEMLVEQLCERPVELVVGRNWKRPAGTRRRRRRHSPKRGSRWW